MNWFKLIKSLTKPWIAGLFSFLLLALICFYTAWSLNDYKPIHSIVPFTLPGLLFCIAGIIFAIYLSSTPARLEKMVLKRTAELDKSEKRNRTIVNALPDMVFIIDHEGHYLDFNNPITHQPIVNPEEFILKKVSDILPGPLAAEVMTYIEKVLLTGQIIDHSYQLEVEATMRSYESRYVPHEINNVMVLVRDTTEAKIAEQSIRESEYKYRTLVEQAADSIFIANFQGNFLVVNPAGCRLSQYTEAELLKMRFHDLAIADELKVMPLKLAEIASGKTAISERKMRRKDGRIIDVEIAARVITPNRFLAFARDITERKKAENDLVRSKEHLRQLNTYIEDVHEAERLNISREIHEELGQHLAVLKMDLSRLGKKIMQTEASLGNDIGELLDLTDTMIETVRKISSELRPSVLDDIGLMAALDWYCDVFTKSTGINASFVCDIPDDKFPKELNTRMFRIFQESLINVVKHSAASKVNVSMKSRGQQLVLLIEDNGKGFDSSTHNQNKTFSIPVMMERAKMLNGSYHINSFPGKGTIVEICIPLDNSN